MIQSLVYLYSKPLNVTLSMAGWIGIAWAIINRKRLRMHWSLCVLFSALLVVYSVYAVKLFALVEAGFDPAKSGGMSLYGMPFFVPVPLLLGALISKRPISEVFDIFSINTVLICMGGRANCFFYGCCQGIMLTQNGFRAPTREIEMLYYLVFLIVMVPKVYKGKTNGISFPLYMASYGMVRFIIEFFRATNFETLFHLAHFWSILCALIGISLLITIREQANGNLDKRMKSRGNVAK